MRRGSEEIVRGIYLIGGPNVTQADDAAVYLIDFSGKLVLIDAGAGGSSSQLVRNIEMLGLDPDAARIFAALEVTWHPMARVLLESQLDRLIEAAILAKTCEALR